MNSNLLLPEIVEVGKDQIKEELIKLGISRGCHVAVTLSFKSIGFVKGGPDAFIDALLEVVGSEGTIMMNTFTMAFPIGEIDPNYVFDFISTVPNTGLIPRTLMKRKNSMRSRHPTCSVVAVGKQAKYLTEGHDENSNEYLPYARLAQIGGKYLSIGLDNQLVAIRHEAQRRAGLFIVPKLVGVQYKTPKGEVKLFTQVYPPCVKKMPELVPRLDEMGLIRRGKIGMAVTIIGSADKLIEAMSVMLKRDPALNLCDDIFCLECRELERRMNLHGRIKNPKFFQKNIIMRLILALTNIIIIRKQYTFFSFYPNSKKEKMIHLIYSQGIAFWKTVLRRFMSALALD